MIGESVRHCLLCGTGDLEPVLNLGIQAFTGIFPASVEDEVPAGPLELVRCLGECGLTQLSRIYPNQLLYGENYGYRSGLNASMVRHLHAIAGKASDRVTLLPGDTVLDIGSNDGTLLGMYPRGLHLVGIDPTARQFAQYYRDDIERIPEFFAARLLGGRQAKIVTSVAMLYDLADPVWFAHEIARVLAPDGVWITEQSYLPTMLKRTAYDTVCHEHLEYYGLRQIQYIAQRTGFVILDVEFNDTNGGSFIVVLGRCGESSDAVRSTLAAESSIDSGVYRDFECAVEARRSELREWLRMRRVCGELVGGYGASTKGNVLLQYCGVTPTDLPWIAEVNERKYGHVTPGTGIPIISEEEAKRLSPDYLLVLPWHFRDHIIQKESSYLLSGGALVFPLPSLDVVQRTEQRRSIEVMTQEDR